MFFDLFTYSFIEGSQLTALKTRQDAIITKSLAIKLFGDHSALGQNIKTEDNRNFVVSGVVEDVKNSHLKKFTLITLISNYEDMNFTSDADREESYNNTSYEVYLLERSNANLLSKIDYIETWMKNNKHYWLLNRGFVNGLVAEPLDGVYFNTISANQSFSNNDPAFLLTIGVTILLVLLFAVINYINMNVSQIGFRARETSLRRLFGASKTELFIGFITESFMLCLGSLVLALFMAFLFCDWFCGVMETTISVLDVFVGYNALALFLGLIVLSVVSGFVPAVIVLQNRPTDIVNGNFKRKTKTIYSKLLIGFQYAISIILIGCCVVIIQQIRYMSTADLGYSKEYIIVCNTSLNSSQQDVYRAKLS